MTAPALGRVVLDRASVTIEGRAGDVDVLDACSLAVESGSFTALVGPSGCGKTTLVNAVAGYLRLSSGSISVDGRLVTGPGVDRLVVFQETRLFPWMTVLDNVTFGPLSRGENRRDAEERARALLDDVGLGGIAGRFPHALSGGMQRRAELARALVNRPAVMLLDEPFRGLDALTRSLMQRYVLDLYEKNRTTHVFVTSEIEEAILLADEVVLLSARPARVRRTLRVDLPRPRTLDMTTTPRYLDILREAVDIVHEEGSRAFARR